MERGTGKVPRELDKGLTTFIGRRLREAYGAGGDSELPAPISKSLAELRAAEEQSDKPDETAADEDPPPDARAAASTRELQQRTL